MPQTLLAILALVGAAFFTIGQKEGSAHTLESIVADEFEVAVAGALIQTIEYADSRAFDEATTPQSLRARLNLPSVLTQVALDTLTLEDVAVPTSSFAAASQFGVGLGGATVRCDSRNQRASVNCNDVSDIHDRVKSTWHDVTLRTPNGDPLPVEVHVEVYYVDATNPDVIVTNRRTNHKRVDVWARSPILMRTNPNHTVHMRRVISFDPAVALEYLKRTTCVVSAQHAPQVDAAQAVVLAAQTAANAAHNRVTSTAATAAAAEATAREREADMAAANTAVAPAQSAVGTTRSTVIAAYYTYAYYQSLVDDAKNSGQKKQAERDRDDALSDFNTAYIAYQTAQSALATATAAADSAQRVSVAAWTAATAAQDAAAQAVRDAEAADRALDEAVAALASLSGCYRA